jgi:hypothetical protein
MKGSFGRGANWRVTRLSGISPFCLFVALLVIAVPSHAQVSHPCSAATSKYYPGYAHYIANIQKAPDSFWRQVTKMGDQLVPTGLAIWNGSGTQGAGVISESVGYAMILAALYDDRATFNKLSLTVQAGIAYNQSKGKPGLFPWWWTAPGPSPTEYSPKDLNSASDADINIALAYVYADMAVTHCGWSNPTLLPTYFIQNSPNFNATPTYQMMARNYITAIRENDFSRDDTNTANNYVLAGGYVQAKSHFSNNDWHPDYSDIRAYQLFQAYDTPDGAVFWATAISTTKICWKAIFNFGSSDPRTENANSGSIDAAKSWVKLSNPTYQNLQASSVDYSKVTATRGGADPQLYTSDSQRLPIRLLNYINATKNSDADMSGIASANLTALGTSYSNTKLMCADQPVGCFLIDKVQIGNPWPQPGSGFIQNFNAAGLFAYASNNTLTYDNRDAVHTDLAKKFGDGNNGTINMDLNPPPPPPGYKDGFNASLTLWGLTVSKDGETPLQKYILSQ